MNAIWRLFDPLWGLIGRHPFLATAALAALTALCFWTHQNFLAMVLGTSTGLVLINEAEAHAPPPNRVEL